MKCSACLCVHNEIEMLPRCLAYLYSVPAVEEVVVVDSGSTDGTQDMLMEWQLGAAWDGLKPLQWQHRPMTGTFGDQRNACLDMASGEWVLTIDADETYTPAVGKLLAELPGRPDLNAVRLGTVTLFPDETHYAPDFMFDPHPRIFRNGFARFRSRLHDCPVSVDGRELHSAADNDVLLCWESPPHVDCLLLHAQMLKSDAALASKVARWQELDLFASSAGDGIPVDPGFWHRRREAFETMRVEPIPERWRM